MDHCDQLIPITAGPCGSVVTLTNASNGQVYPVIDGVADYSAGQTLYNGGELPCGDWELCIVASCCDDPDIDATAETRDIKCPTVSAVFDGDLNVDIDFTPVIDAINEQTATLVATINAGFESLLACLCDDCTTDPTPTCTPGATEHLAEDNTTDLTFSYNDTTLKIDKANDPFNSASAQVMLDAVKACIDNGGSVNMEFEDPDGNIGSFTATSVTSESPTQNLYAGTGTPSATPAGKAARITATCICP